MHTRACGISHTHRGPPLGQGLQREADETATEAEAFKLLARLEYSEAEINQCFDFAASRLRVKPNPFESHAKP
jgi:hypothetical protein